MTPARRGHLAMLAFSALIAGSFSLGSTVANDIAPAALNAVRFWIAATLIAVLAWRRGLLTAAVLVAPWRYLLLGGLFGAYLVLMLEGLKTAPPVSTAAVFTLTPILSGIFGWLLLRQVFSRRISGALAIGAAGALWVIFRADLAALLAFDVGRGEAIYFVGCISHALYTPLVKRLNRGESALVSTLGTLVAGGVLVSLWGAPDIAATNWTGLSLIVWVAIVYMAVAATAVTVVLIQYASMRLPASKVMAYTYLTPSWVILWEIALRGAVPPPLILGGVGLTLLALALLLRD
jgi:drug/metabolite transporter (DMT)-like permease